MTHAIPHIILSSRLLSTEGVALFLLAVVLAVLVWGAANVCSQLFMKVLCRGNKQKKQIALTFDDGPSGYTGKILEILAKHKVQATFFVIGRHAEKAPELLREIQNQGHLIGNHTYSHHYFFDLYTKKKMAKDIARANSVIADITGETPKYFRPPYGVTNPTLAKAVKITGLKAIGWSLRSLDTVKSAAKLRKKLLHKTGSGKIILFHDTMPATVEILDNYITEVKNKGYKVVPLHELF